MWGIQVRDDPQKPTGHAVVVESAGGRNLV